jgi:hypothetical protein
MKFDSGIDMECIDIGIQNRVHRKFPVNPV